jgi:hypothetical protein
MPKTKRRRADDPRNARRTARRKDASPPAPAGAVARAPAGEDIALRLQRRLHTLAGRWRRCREPVCRRAKSCRGAKFSCARAAPQKQLTPEQQARRMAMIYRAVMRRVAELEAAGEFRAE